MSFDFSVLISVYAKERSEFLDKALESVWDSQTLKPSQIVLVEDGPLTEELDMTILKWKSKLSNNFKLMVVSLTPRSNLQTLENSPKSRPGNKAEPRKTWSWLWVTA